MSALTFGSNWENVVETTTGAGSVVSSNGLLTCTSIVGDNAKVTKYVMMQAGDMIRVSVMCRRKSGSLPMGGIAINNVGTQAHAACDSDYWQRIECTYSLPLTATTFDTVSVDVGVFTADDGSVEYSEPKIDIFNSTVGHNRVVACGLVAIAAGVPTINSGFTAHGILGLSYNAGTMELSITIPRSTGAAFSSPLFFVEANGGGVASAHGLIAKQTTYAAATGVIKVKFYDTVTNAFIDLTSVGSMFMFFKAEVN